MGFSWWFKYHGRFPNKSPTKTNPKIIIPRCSMYGTFYLHVIHGSVDLRFVPWMRHGKGACASKRKRRRPPKVFCRWSCLGQLRPRWVGWGWRFRVGGAGWLNTFPTNVSIWGDVIWYDMIYDQYLLLQYMTYMEHTWNMCGSYSLPCPKKYYYSASWHYPGDCLELLKVHWDPHNKVFHLDDMPFFVTFLATHLRIIQSFAQENIVERLIWNSPVPL